MIIIQSSVKSKYLPSNSWFEETTNKILITLKKLTTNKEYELSCDVLIKIVSKAEITKLNNTYRGKNASANILSFPNYAIKDVPKKILLELKPNLGDIVICFSVVKKEAQASNKPVVHHITHLIIHGVLHLLGYTHEKDDDVRQMEGVEIEVLKKFAIDNPYLTL